MFEIFDNDLSGFNTLEDQESRDLYPNKPEPYCVVEGTYYNLPKTSDLVLEWVEEIMLTEEDWQLASEPDQGELDEEWGLEMDLDSRLLLEHIATKKRLLTRKLATFQKMLNNNGLNAGTAKEMKPQRRNGVMMMRVVWPMEDGQTVSAVFQVMGELSNKQIQPNTEMVTFQWKVNSKDVTRFLYTIDRKASSENRASRKGLSPQMLAKKLGAYVKANTESFTKKKAETEQLTKDLESQSSVNDTLDNELETARSGISEIESRIEANDAEIASLESELSGLLDQIEELKKKPIGPADGEDRSTSDEEDADVDVDGVRDWRDFTEDGWIDMGVGLGKRAHTELELELSEYEQDPEVQKYLNSDMPKSIGDLLKQYWEVGWKAAREELEEDGLGSFDDGSDSSLDPENYKGSKSLGKLKNHPNVTRALENIASELKKVGEENLDSKDYNLVETLRYYFGGVAQSAKPEALDFGGTFSLSNMREYLIDMLNEHGREFFSLPIQTYMEQESIPFFDLFEIGGTTSDFQIRLNSDVWSKILSQVGDGGSEEEEEEETGGDSEDQLESMLSRVADEMRRGEGILYNSIQSASQMLLPYHNQAAAAYNGETFEINRMMAMFRNYLNNTANGQRERGGIEFVDEQTMRLLIIDTAKRMADEYDMDVSKIRPIADDSGSLSFSYEAADLGDNGDDDVEPVDDTDRLVLSKEEQKEKLQEVYGYGRTRGFAFYMKAKELEPEGYKEYTYRMKMDGKAKEFLDRMKWYQTPNFNSPASVFDASLYKSYEEGWLAGVAQAREEDEEETGGGNGALEAEAQRLLNSDDMIEVAEWFGDNADMLQGANMDLFTKLNDHMIELAMAA